jgi:drug/metabolite transporter (DMT)-like permease
LGYAIWYAALRDLTTSQAGVMQLLVPIIAALGGVVFANELLSGRLIVASMLTLGGILIVLLAKSKTG